MEHPQPPKKVQVLLCGCGNAVHVLIAYLAQNFSNRVESTVNVLSSHGEDLAKSLPRDGCIECRTDKGTTISGKAKCISNDPAKLVIAICIIILFALPMDRHEQYLQQMKPYIAKNTMIGSMAAEGGFDLCIRNVLGPSLTEKCILFSLETMPWACRIHTFGQKVQILGTKKDIDLCVRPGQQFSNVREIVQAMIGPLPVVKGRSTSTFLGVTLMNPNAIAHPSIECGLLRDWDGQPFEKPPLFYQNVDTFTANVMERVSDEILQVKKVIQDKYLGMDLELVRSICELLEEAYADDIQDHSSLRNMFNSN